MTQAIHSRLLASLAVLGAALVAGPAQATPPGSNGRIAFERPTRGDQPPSDLFAINPDGSAETRLFAGPRHESEAAFSPTQSAVAFTREGSRTPPDIYVGDTATGQVSRLTRHRAFTSAPAFSPDGARIAYFTDKDFPPPSSDQSPPPPPEIYVMNADGSRQRRLTRDRLSSQDPDFSPDGRRIVYMESRARGRGFQNRLVIIGSDGRNRRVLTRFGGANEVNAKWTPDGRRIVFELLRRGGTLSDIAMIGADGAGLRRVLATRAWETNPIPSPDGTKVVFTGDRDRRGRDRLGPGFELYTMNVDGTGITRLTNNRQPDVFPDWQRLP